MHSRLIPALLCAAAIAFACGPHPHGSAQSVAAAAAPKPVKKGKAAVKSEPKLATSLDVRVADEVAFTLHLTNSGSKLLELTFPSGQTHDFAVLDSTGREVWRWSRDLMFTQSLQTKQIAVGETVGYTAAIPRAGLSGRYTVVATLQSASNPVEQQASFTLP